MRKQIGFWALMAVLAGTSGCASNALRDDGTPIFGPKAWDAPPAPPQRPVRLTADTTSLPTDTPSLRQRLAGSISSLTKKQALPPSAVGTPLKNPEEPPALAETRWRPTWFGLRPQKPAVPTTYMTDAREQLNRPGPVPTTLPVALQVPTSTARSDGMVTPTAGTTTRSAPLTTQGVVIGEGPAKLPDFGGKPSAPGEDEVNPLPPAAEPGTPAAIQNRVAQAVAANPIPITPPTPDSDRKPGSPSTDEETVLVASTADDKVPPASPSTTPTPPTSQSNQAPQPLIPTASRQTVLASPQTPPPPSPQPKPSPQAQPSPQAKPSPQSASATDTTWRRPCLRRLVRKVWHLGEFADPPTAASH